MENTDRLPELVAQVASAYFANNHVGCGDISTVINQIASCLTPLSTIAPRMSEIPAPEASPLDLADATKTLSASQIRKSITPDALISFEDNRPYRTLKRHLTAKGLTPNAYREKWGLPADYPMTSASYSAARSIMARSIGLGTPKGRKARRRKSAAPALREHS